MEMRFMRRLMMVLAAGLFTPVAAHAQYVTVSGTVLDSITGLPVENVMVYLTDRTSTQTGGDGRFTLRRAPAEETLVMFRRIGYSPRALRLNLERRSGTAVDLGDITMFSVPVEVDEITIESRLVNRNPRLHDYFRRLKQGRGDFITRQDIWKKNPVTTSEMLRGIPGVTVNCAYLTACTPSTMRKGSQVATMELTCPMRVLLDGQPVPINVDEIPPAWIAGIEVYRSANFTPIELMSSRSGTELGSSACGTVVIWTGGDDY
jgi:hypothetical protein